MLHIFQKIKKLCAISFKKYTNTDTDTDNRERERERERGERERERERCLFT